MNLPTASPVERLILTRERLRVALAERSGGAARGEGAAAALAGLPAIGALLQAARKGWSAQPLGLAVPLAAQVATAALQPLARQHPLALVGAAGAAGALLLWSKPWRWRALAALVAGALPQLLVKAVAVCSSAQPPKAPPRP